MLVKLLVHAGMLSYASAVRCSGPAVMLRSVESERQLGHGVISSSSQTDNGNVLVKTRTKGTREKPLVDVVTRVMLKNAVQHAKQTGPGGRVNLEIDQLGICPSKDMNIWSNFP